MATQNEYSVDFELSNSEYAEITDGNQTGLDITGDFSCEAWIKLEQLPSTATSTMAIISKDDASTERAYTWYISSGDDKIRLEFFDASGNRTVHVGDTALTSSDVGVWVHLAVTADVSVPTLTFYKNGVADTTTASLSDATSIADTAAEFGIGARAARSTVDIFFDGSIDEVSIYSGLRTQADIVEYMLQQKPHGTDANYKGYWRMENNFNDETSNGNDLTGVNTPTFNNGADDVPFTFYLEDGDNLASVDLESGDSDYLSITDASQTGLDITGDISVEAWVKLEQLASTKADFMVIASKYDFNSDQRAWLFRINSSDELDFFFSEDGGSTNYTEVTTTSSVFSASDVGEWVHVAVTADVSAGASGVTFYKDGSSVATTTENDAGTSIFDSSASFAIGAYDNSGSGDDFFDGKTANVRVYSDIRTATEITDNMMLREVTDGALEGNWSFDGDYTDLSGNSNTLTASGSPEFSPDPPFDDDMNRHSSRFEQDDADYLKITDADQTGLDLSGDFTIEAWLKPQDQPGNNLSYAIVCKLSGSGSVRAYDLIYRNSGGTLQFIITIEGASDGSTTDQVTYDHTLSLTEWTHLAVTCDISEATASTFEFFINGTSQGNGSANISDNAGSIYNSDGDFTIGYRGGADSWDGLKDNVMVFNDIRTSSEITSDMTAISIDDANLKGHWRLDNNYLDLSGNDNHLTPSGSPEFSWIVDSGFAGEVARRIFIIS